MWHLTFRVSRLTFHVSRLTFAIWFLVFAPFYLIFDLKKAPAFRTGEFCFCGISIAVSQKRGVTANSYKPSLLFAQVDPDALCCERYYCEHCDCEHYYKFHFKTLLYCMLKIDFLFFLLYCFAALLPRYLAAFIALLLLFFLLLLSSCF